VGRATLASVPPHRRLGARLPDEPLRFPGTLLGSPAMRTAMALLFATILIGACSADATEETARGEAPDTVVADWLAALADLDLGGLSATTTPENVALLAGAENGLTAEQMAAILDDGLPPATARSYWSTFRESFATMLGAPIAEVAVSGVGRFSVDNREFAAVGLQIEDAGTEVVVAATEAGWRVDLVATLGPALAVQIRRLVAQIVEEADDAVARRYARAASISLGAALARDPENRALDLEVEAIEDLPVDLSG
jgi:hypothetical protein